jgi:hypothetical protein
MLKAHSPPNAVTDTNPRTVAEGFERQRKQMRFFFGEHGRNLPFGRGHGCAFCPSAVPSDPDTPALTPDSRRGKPALKYKGFPTRAPDVSNCVGLQGN